MSLAAAAMPSVRISEIHYDNAGDDTGEAVEISGPAGTSLAGWKLVFYNGASTSRLPYRTTSLSQVIPTTCGRRGVVVATYPQDGIQNGAPDGIALVDASNQVIEFLSYEGVFKAAGTPSESNPAGGMDSKDIAASEGGSTPVGHSLQRSGADTWSDPAANTFGACNDQGGDEPPPPPPPPPLPETRISEIHYDNGGEDAGEAIEIEGPAGIDLTGWSIVLYNGNGGAQYSARSLSGTIPATCGTRGVVFVSYLPNGVQNGPDGIALVDATGKVVEFLSYEGTVTAAGGPAGGMTSVDVGVAEASSTPADRSLQRDAEGKWGAAAPWTFGACNTGTTPPPPVITFSGRAADDVLIPVGFEDQLFASLRLGGATVPSTFTWSSETPNIASVDEDGVVRAVAAGTAVIRATASDGTIATVSLETHVATSSTTARYEGNAEFGEPTDRNASDDFIVQYPQFTASYNKAKGTPNWVSYNLEATHFGDEDRCDCFTFDPKLPAEFTRYTTADYTGAGAFHGYGIDRGHLARSADRTSASLDNATTFYFTNIIPQAADNNQGPWATMENDIGNLARNQGREVYVVTGVAGSKGTVKNEGKITIPTHVWKVAVIMPRDRGLEHVDDYGDLEIIAVIMPNEPGIRGVKWETYKTTVDAIEGLSGYDLLRLLPDRIETQVESGLDKALALTDRLVGSDAISAGDGKWINNKLELAVDHLIKGLRIPAVNQLEDILRRLDALVAAGKLSAANAASLSTIVKAAVESASS